MSLLTTLPGHIKHDRIELRRSTSVGLIVTWRGVQDFVAPFCFQTQKKSRDLCNVNVYLSLALFLYLSHPHSFLVTSPRALKVKPISSNSLALSLLPIFSRYPPYIQRVSKESHSIHNTPDVDSPITHHNRGARNWIVAGRTTMSRFSRDTQIPS